MKKSAVHVHAEVAGTPSIDGGHEQVAREVDLESLPQALQTFMFCGCNDREDPPALGSGTAFFLSLLASDTETMQSQCMAIGELLAVMGALVLTAASTYTPTREESCAWGDVIKTGDVFDGINILAKLTLTVTCAIGFAGGCIVAAAGASKDIAFFAGILDVLGLGMMTLFVGLTCTLAIISYDAARASHPVMASIFVSLGLLSYGIFSAGMTRVFTHMPLEFYHMPGPMKINVRMLTFMDSSFFFGAQYSAEECTYRCKRHA
jgi:hypothetical protein